MPARGLAFAARLPYSAGPGMRPYAVVVISQTVDPCFHRRDLLRRHMRLVHVAVDALGKLASGGQKAKSFFGSQPRR